METRSLSPEQPAAIETGPERVQRGFSKHKGSNPRPQLDHKDLRGSVCISGQPEADNSEQAQQYLCHLLSHSHSKALSL